MTPVGAHTQLSSGRGIAGYRIGAFSVTSVFLDHSPLHPGKIHAVILPGFRRPVPRQAFGNRPKGNHHLRGPACILSIRPVDAPFNCHGSAQAVDVIAVNRIYSVPVGGRKEQIPYRIQHIHFKFIILLGVGVRINKDFKIVILENDLITSCYISSDFISVKLRTDIKVFIIPEHLSPCLEMRGGHMCSLDIDEFNRKRSISPEIFVRI